jgi:hypothetical protein
MLAFMATAFLLTGCTKDCGFLYLSNDTPALKKNDYNSCEAIVRNLAYKACGRDGYYAFPYWANEQDTIMVCGYLYEYWDWAGDRDHFALYDSPNNANEHFILVEIKHASYFLPEEIDISKKCYIKGRLYFSPINCFGGWDIRPYIYGVYDLHFE